MSNHVRFDEECKRLERLFAAPPQRYTAELLRGATVVGPVPSATDLLQHQQNATSTIVARARFMKEFYPDLYKSHVATVQVLSTVSQKAFLSAKHAASPEKGGHIPISE